MFILDIKDFRNHSDYEIPLYDEEKIVAALEECGVLFDSPFALRLRVKDIDQRMILAKGDAVDRVGDEFRLNLYFTPFIPNDEFVEDMNLRIRHTMVHFAQTRACLRSGVGMTAERILKFEVEAQEQAEAGVCDILGTFPDE